MWLSERERIFIANYGVVAPTERSLLAWRLGVRVVGIGFIGFVMADNAAGRSAHFPVTGHVAGYAADDSTFDAPFCISAGDRRYRDSCYASRRKNPLHAVSSNSEDQFGQAKTVPAVPSDYDAIEVSGYPAVREDTGRLGQNIIAAVAAGNMGENELLYVARGRERCRFRRSKMAVVERHLCIAIEKRRFDDQYVGVPNVLGQAFRGFGVAHDHKLFALGWRP
jgi:hypothetical protein